MIKVENISKSFRVDKQEIIALKNINFEVRDGEFKAIIGPSGCGKSTLLRVIAGLQQPSTGKINWETAPKIGFVFQNFALFPYLTVYENIAFGLKMNGVKKDQITNIVNELISEMGLIGFESKHPKELSGGMRQRVGIARSLAIEPNILLLDEPFSSLDEFTAEKLRQLLINIWQKRKITVLMVTHLISEAIELADSIVVMSHSPGEVRKVVENDLSRPRNLRSEKVFQLEDSLRELIKT